MKFYVLPVLLCFLLACKGPVENKKHTETIVQAEAICIEKILEEDSKLGKIRNHAPEGAPISDAIDSYASALKILDYSGCPEDFKNAFFEHINAWLETKKVTDKHSELRGEMHDVFENIEKSVDSTEFKLLVKRIWDTWAVVEEHSDI